MAISNNEMSEMKKKRKLRIKLNLLNFSNINQNDAKRKAVVKSQIIFNNLNIILL